MSYREKNRFRTRLPKNRGRFLLVASPLLMLLPFPRVQANANPPSTPANAQPSGRAIAPCSVEVCVSVDSTRPIESASHQASGLLHSINGSSLDSAYLGRLGVAMWRSSDQDWGHGVGPWSATKRGNIPTTFVLSDKWLTYSRGGAIAPWADWGAYASWVRASVEQITNAGIPVDYWEVYNEPDVSNGSHMSQTATPERLLRQFLLAYRAIKSVAPNAQVIGPSLGSWRNIPTSRVFSMPQFVSFAAQNGISLAALSWHYNTVDPSGIMYQVSEARALLSRNPELTQTKIFINEFGSEQTQRIPGWDVQYLAALTNARVDSAGRSCWGSDCYMPTFDGLLGPDGSSTRPDFWVRADYGQMAGTMIVTSVNSDHVGALAALDPVRSQINVLIGYGQGCIQDPRCLATTASAIPSVPRATQLSVAVPWMSGHVSVQESRINGTSISPLSQPAIASVGSLPIVDSSGVPTVRVYLGLVVDGDAWSVTLTHTS